MPSTPPLPSPDIPSAPRDWASDPAGPRLGRFVLGPELGRGGMGVVHLAWDPMLRRRVALKRLICADPLLALRLAREAQIQAKVEHPRICKVFEVGSEEGRPYIAMQYIQGGTLGEARERLNPGEKARIMAEVAGAIHVAHRLGLIHRDLKPSNILIEAGEGGGCTPCILDFGLARDLSSADLTLSWGLVGTPAFMSPEQARAEPPTPASDIYGLGATFYAVFGGHPPYEAITLAGLLAQHVEQEVRPLRSLIPGFPKDLDTILLKCLESDPARRYGSAFELEEDLRRWLAGEPIQARPTGPFGRIWRRIRRHRTLSAALAGGLGLSLALLGWNLHSGRRARAQVELAQHFALEVREVEQLLRIERMLPPHDIRPAEVQVRRRMEAIRGMMSRLGNVANGPGHYALGRGHLALLEYTNARGELEAAWSAGFRSPEVAYALGTALLELYLPERLHSRPSDPAGEAALRARYVEPALAFFGQARGQALEDPTLGEAQAALLTEDYSRCIKKSREAFAARPWMVEAKLLEARALNAMAGQAIGMHVTVRRDPKTGYSALAEGQKALDEALVLAPSDERLHQEWIGMINARSVLDSDGGRPDPAIFAQAESHYLQAMIIRPDDTALRYSWAYAQVRHGFALLRLGEDVRPLMRQTLARIREDARFQAPELKGVLGCLRWILADGHWRRGVDPLPELKIMAGLFPPGGFSQVQPACIQAEYLASRGRDPLPALREAEGILDARYSEQKGDFYFFTVWGTVLLSRADWEMEAGLDPSPTLDRAVLRLEEGYRLNPKVVYPCFFLAQIHARKALRAMALGQDPGPALQAAFEATRRGFAITDGHYRLHLALAEAHHVQALDLARRGMDPAPALVSARAALDAGRKINPTDFRLHRAGAELELFSAEQILQGGHSPLEALARAEASAHQGLRFKGDYPWFRLALGRAQRIRAQWALEQGEDPGGRVAEGKAEIKQALALHPRLREALAERDLLASLRAIEPKPPR